MRTRFIALIMVIGVIAAACGTRVSEQQAIAEAQEDANRAGLTGGFAAGAGGSASDPTAVGSGTSGLGSTGGTTGGTGGTSGAGGGGTTGGTGGDATTGGGGTDGGGGGGDGTDANTGPVDNGGATDVGVTANEIRVGNVATLSGPVPGLFRGALVGTQAYFAFKNSQGGVHGRKITVVSADDRLDDGANRAAHLDLQEKVFGFVGSFSVNDGGGAEVLRESGVPDIGLGLALARKQLPNNFAPNPGPPGWRSGPPNYYAEKYGADVIEKTAFYVAAVPSARQLAVYQRRAYEEAGFKVVYTREIGPNEPNFTSDVIQMQRLGVRALVYNGDVGNMARMAQAMKQQNFSVDLPSWGGSAYSQAFIDQAGADVVEGVEVDQVFAMYLGEDAEQVPEINTFLEWMKRVDPNTAPDLFALYGYTSAMLFTQALEAAGPEAKRETLLAELGKVTSFDANGIFAPASPAEKKTSGCFMTFTIKNGKFERVFPDQGFSCDYGPYLYM